MPKFYNSDIRKNIQCLLPHSESFLVLDLVDQSSKTLILFYEYFRRSIEKTKNTYATIGKKCEISTNMWQAITAI